MAREMKDSGIEWIGEIPREWVVQKLKHSLRWKSEKGQPDSTVLSLYRDYGIIPKDSRDDNHNVTSLDTSNYKVVNKGDFVINKMKAWQGSMAVSNYDGIVSPAYHVCEITNQSIYLRYFHYLLRDQSYLPEYRRLSSGLGIGQWDLGFDDFKNIPFLVPPFYEQQSIADFLDTQCAHIDSVIEKTCAAVEEYKKLKQAVITQAVTKGIRPNREMKDSGIEWIGEVPSAFVCRKLKSLALLISKGATPKDISIELDNRHIVRFLKSENIVDNHLKEKPEFRITTDIHEGELKRSVLSENDILFVIAGASIGKTAVMEIGLLPANTNQAVSFIRIESKYCFAKKYIWYFLQSEVVKRFIFLFAVQSAQPNLSMENLGSIRMPFPKSKEEVLEIITYLDEKTAAIDSLIQKKEQLISELEAYKKSLIYEYVTGKKEVPVHAH